MTNNTATTPTPVGVIGVGSMGQHHVRVYDSLPNATLVGVTDADTDRAAELAATYDTTAYTLNELLERVEAVSIAVPTQFHFDVASRCLNTGVDVLMEKPLAASIAEAERLIEIAEDNDQLLQVGHIERFNPAVQTLSEFIDDLEIVSINAERLGPPPGRRIDDSAVLDLMIHDIDVVLSLLGESPTQVLGAGVRENRHATATLAFESDVIARLTASRLTQKKIRKLDVIAEDCLVRLDYIDKNIEIHRQSRPEYITQDESVRFRHESIVERPMVDATEPLMNELSAFLKAVRTRSEPKVTGKDGLEALHLAKYIDDFDASSSFDIGSINISSEVSLD